MKECRWREFVEDGKGVGSGTSLAFLFTVSILGSAVVFMTMMQAYMEAVSMAGILAGASGLTKMSAKWNDTSVEKAAYNPAPVEPEPQQGVNINVGAQSEGEPVLKTKSIITKSLVVGKNKRKR